MASGDGKMGNGFLFDNQPYTCVIESSINIKSHTEYALRVTPQLFPKEESWVVSKRYSDFVNLCDSLKHQGVDLVTLLPPKKVFGRLDDDFIAERLKGLQAFLNQMLSLPWISHCVEFKSFLSPTLSSNLSFEEVALENATMLLRSELRWEIIQALPNLGWRTRKCYFLCRDKTNPKQKFILTWCGINQRCCLDVNAMEKVMKLLMSIEHPYIAPMLFATCNATCVVVIRPYYEHGSLRDNILAVNKPTNHYLRKYASSTAPSSLQISDVRYFGRQILEVASALRAKGFPYVHIHAGNLAIVDGNIQLTDLENSFSGIPSVQRAHYVKLRKLKTLESLEVYCFGHLLFEMITGSRLSAINCDTQPRGCPSELWSVLESILSTNACKHDLPTLSSLLQHSFFSGGARLPLDGSALQCKVGSRLKESLKNYIETSERVLHEEQRKFHQQQCLLKAQAFHMSAEEKEKRRLRKVKSLHDMEQNGSTEVRSNDGRIASSISVVERNGSFRSSTSSAAGPGGNAAPPPPPPPPVVGPVVPGRQVTSLPAEGSNVPAVGEERSALLSSICSFKKTALKKR